MVCRLNVHMHFFLTCSLICAFLLGMLFNVCILLGMQSNICIFAWHTVVYMHIWLACSLIYAFSVGLLSEIYAFLIGMQSNVCIVCIFAWHAFSSLYTYFTAFSPSFVQFLYCTCCEPAWVLISWFLTALPYLLFMSSRAFLREWRDGGSTPGEQDGCLKVWNRRETPSVSRWILLHEEAGSMCQRLQTLSRGSVS